MQNACIVLIKRTIKTGMDETREEHKFYQESQVLHCVIHSKISNPSVLRALVLATFKEAPVNTMDLFKCFT